MYSYCDDSDGGDVPAVKGLTKIIRQSDGEVLDKGEDRCFVILPEGNKSRDFVSKGNWLSETICGESRIRFVNHECTCVDGACQTVGPPPGSFGEADSTKDDLY